MNDRLNNLDFELVIDQFRRRRWAGQRVQDIIQIMAHPSSGNLQVWDVQAVPNIFLTDMQVVQTVWRRDLEPTPILTNDALKNWEPKIEVKSANLDKERLTVFISRFQAANFPVFKPHDGQFLDGTIYELAMSEGLCGARIYWHCQMPKGWEGLQKLLDEFMTFLKTAIEQ